MESRKTGGKRVQNPFEAAEQRQKIAHGVSRGLLVRRKQAPSGATDAMLAMTFGNSAAPLGLGLPRRLTHG